MNSNIEDEYLENVVIKTKEKGRFRVQPSVVNISNISLSTLNEVRVAKKQTYGGASESSVSGKVISQYLHGQQSSQQKISPR